MNYKLIPLVLILCSVAWKTKVRGALSANSSAYTYYPPKPCAICNTLHTGFTASQAAITNITSSASSVISMLPPCPPTQSADVLVVVSRITTNVAGNTQFVTCPPGYFALNCRCTNQDEGCAGIVTASNNGIACSVRTGVANEPVRGIATCVRNNGRFFVISAFTTQNPLAECGPMTKMVDCWLENRGMIPGGITTIISGTQCRVSALCEDSTTTGCRLTAICERI